MSDDIKISDVGFHRWIDKPEPLDIRVLGNLTREELHKEIENAVHDTQLLVVRSMPDKLIMTASQYDILQPDVELQGVYADPVTDFQLYRTKYNVMEVEIKDPIVDALKQLKEVESGTETPETDNVPETA